jgi:hypothetical protein
VLTEIVDLNLAEVFTPEQPRPCDSHPCGPNAHCRVNLTVHAIEHVLITDVLILALAFVASNHFVAS